MLLGIAGAEAGALSFPCWPRPHCRCPAADQPLVSPCSAGALLLLLVAAAAYSSGRRSGRLQVSGCAGLTPPTLQGDTVAPEGTLGDLLLGCCCCSVRMQKGLW